MKKTVRIFCFLASFAIVFVLNVRADMVLLSSISHVTVYSDRAVVDRTTRLNLTTGEQRLIFDSLPSGIDSESMQVRVSSGVILSDLIFQTKYLTEVPDAKIAELNASKENRETALLAENDKINRLREEKAFLNKIVTKVTTVTETEEAELNPDQWIKMISFYRERLAELDIKIREAEKTVKGLRVEIEQISLELRNLMAGRTREIKQAVVVLNVKNPGDVTLVLTYAVLGPNWNPVYDLRVDSEKKTLELTYYANIKQNTGEDWNNIPLTLSTAKPNINGIMPEMDPWYLSLYAAQNQRAKKAYDYDAKSEAAAPMYNMMEESVVDSMADEKDYSGYGEATAKTGAVAVLFNVPGGSTIASDNNQHKIGIMTRTFNAVFRYSAVPKLTTYAYLKAKVKNETDYPLLPGLAKIFLDGNFVSTGALPMVSPTEEFWTYLGIDESVVIDYKLVRKYDSEEGFMGKKKKTIYEYETVIKNKKGQEIEIVIFDQLPISTDERIIVKLIEPKYTKDSDVLKKNNTEFFEWLFHLKPSEETKIKFSFSVEYPTDYILNGM